MTRVSVMNIPPGIGSVPYFQEAEVATTVGVFVKVLEFTVPAGKARDVEEIGVSCRKSGVMEVRIGATVIGKRRTAPGKPDAAVKYSPRRTITAGTTVELHFCQTAGTVSTTDVHGYVMAEDRG